MLATEDFPTFQSLKALYGFENALRRWKDHHGEKECILVAAWPDKVFLAIHEEVARRLLEDRDISRPSSRGRSFQYDRPPNRPYLVTPTGGRLSYSTSVMEGQSAPLDPPTDELLLLTWQFFYWDARAKRVARAFVSLKERLEEAADSDRQSVADLEKLKELHRTAKSLKANAARINKKREPLLPRSLREPTPAEKAIEVEAESRRAARRSSFKKELDRLEL